MKSFVLLLSASALAFSADSARYATGQSARAVIGQVTFTAQDPNTSPTDATVLRAKNAQVGLSGRNVTILGAVGGIAIGNGTLVVADANRVQATPANSRVLIYRNLTRMMPSATSDPTANVDLPDRCPVCIGVADNVVGQTDFLGSAVNLSRTGLRTPTAVATDGTRLVVSDTDNNRVLIWNTIPTSDGAPADLVLGQPDFVTNRVGLTAKNLRGPQGVWLQGGRLMVADTQNNRVLIWNSFPSSNQQAADVVLGQPNFTTANAPDIRTPQNSARANNLYNPVHVSSDGQRLYVTDLGFNRVLVWNSIPTSNQAPADFAVGQLDLNSGLSNDTTRLCDPVDPTASPLAYPGRCAATLSFPRAAVSDGNRLFIADGGNDRVLVYETIPTLSAKRADAVLGQPTDVDDKNSSEDVNAGQSSAADAIRTPLGLAVDNTSVYVSDPFNRRILVFSPGAVSLPYSGFRNFFSRNVFALGRIDLTGKATAGNTITVAVGDASYVYTVTATDTLGSIVDGIVAAINNSNGSQGDPLLLAIPDRAVNAVLLTARQNGSVGTTITVTATTSASADVVAAVTNPQITGQVAGSIAPGAIVTIQTDQVIADQSLVADQILNPVNNGLSTNLGGVQVFFDGLPAPIFAVDPHQVTVQVPFEVADGTNSTAFIRSTLVSGVQTSTAIAVPIVGANPGILAQEGTEPRRAVAVHASSNAAGTVLLTGTATTNDTASITIEDRTYTRTIVDGDTLDSVRDDLVTQINNNGDERVTATTAPNFDRIILKAKVAGPDGNGITYSAASTGTGNITLTPSSGALCCANQAGAPVTSENPAQAGEQIIVYATGLGPIGPVQAAQSVTTGFKYLGDPFNNPLTPVDDSLVGGRTANVLSAGLKYGAIGVYEVLLELNSAIVTNDVTQLTIAQGFFVSNIVTVPVVNANPPSAQ